MIKKEFLQFDHQMMEEALLEARLAFEEGEVPVGAVLALEGKVVARAHNQVERLKDPSAHAELLCIRAGADFLGDWRLLNATLYTTLEPCLMCAGALLLSRVKRVVWGAPDLRHGAHGSYLNVFDTKHPTHTLSIEGGLLESSSATLMKEFFRKQRGKHEKIAHRAL